MLHVFILWQTKNFNIKIWIASGLIVLPKMVTYFATKFYKFYWKKMSLGPFGEHFKPSSCWYYLEKKSFKVFTC